MMSLRYWGEIASRDAHLIRVEIYQETENAFTPEEVFFPWDTPIDIEWANKDKYEPVQSSSATLKLLSDTDRRFIDLYTEVPGSIRMDIKRDGSLYWSGTLDCELYEEPYAYLENYVVTLTFSDFAILKRLKWSRTGIETYQTILQGCLDRMGINTKTTVIGISLRKSNAAILTFSEISINNDNFYDEECEPMTVMEVLEGILQPLALRIIQTCGILRIYDLNSTYTSDTPTQIEWNSNDSSLSVDKVFNDLLITFSPYDEPEVIKGEVATTEDDLSTSIGDNELTVYLNYDNASTLDGFKIYFGNIVEGSGLTLSNGAQFFRMNSIYSGEDATGFMWCIRSGKVGMDEAASGQIQLKGMVPGNPIAAGTDIPLSHGVIAVCPLKYLAHSNDGGLRLRINLDVLFDVRYNPFEDAKDHNEEGNYDKLQNWCNFGFIPIILNFKDAAGNVICHYENSGMINSNNYQGRSSLCKWTAGAGAEGDAYLAYYDQEDRRKKSGFGGWKTNKQSIGYYTDVLPVNYAKLPAGEYIELPSWRFNCDGYLELKICAGVHQFDYNREVKAIYPLIRWLLYRNPSITIVNNNGTSVESEDITTRAWINADAAEGLEISTILGTEGLPSAKGRIIGFPSVNRAGRCNTLEKLLCGTIYSQYATRKNVLSGTTKLIAPYGKYTDASISGVFILAGQVQDLKADETNVTMVELGPEEYDGIEYE